MMKPWCSRCMRPVDSLRTNKALDIIIRCHGTIRVYRFGEKIPNRIGGHDRDEHPQLRTREVTHGR